MLLEASIRVQEQVKARRIECNSTMFFKMTIALYRYHA